MGLLGKGREPGPGDGVTPADELAALSEELEQASEESRRSGARRAKALVGTVARALGRGGAVTAKGAGLGGKALAERLFQVAPRIPVRDLATLRAQHPEAADPDALAQVLVRGAVRASAAVGASIGAAAMLPVPPAMVVELAAETLVVAALELKLIAELHEVYGLPATGSLPHRTSAYLAAWADRRGIDAGALTHPSGVVAVAGLAVGAEVRSKVRKRMTRSTLRKLPSMTPLLVGAGLGATLNRRDTGKLAGRVRSDLRARTDAAPGYWEAAAPRPSA